MNRLNAGFLVLGAVLTAGFGATLARAADMGAPILSPSFVKAAAPAPVLYVDPNRYEIRFGAFDHGVGGPEKDSVSLNGEFVFPRLPFGVGEWWNILIPRPHIGGNVNLSGRTNVLYAGALWTFPLTERIFAEGFFDGAIHDGSLTGAPNMAALGCRGQFHVGGSLGYAFTTQWSAMFTFDHVSNGQEVFGTDCPRNQGLNNYGARLSYSFGGL